MDGAPRAPARREVCGPARPRAGPRPGAGAPGTGGSADGAGAAAAERERGRLRRRRRRAGGRARGCACAGISPHLLLFLLLRGGARACVRARSFPPPRSRTHGGARPLPPSRRPRSGCRHVGAAAPCVTAGAAPARGARLCSVPGRGTIRGARRRGKAPHCPTGAPDAARHRAARGIRAPLPTGSPGARPPAPPGWDPRSSPLSFGVTWL